METNVIVKTVARDELDRVLDLIDQFDRPTALRPTDAQLDDVFHNITGQGGCVVGAFDGANLIGTCTLNMCANLSWNARPYAIIENVIVNKEKRGLGIGKKLLGFAVDWAKQKSCYKVALMTGSKRDSTLKFYESAGFEQSKTGFQIRF